MIILQSFLNLFATIKGSFGLTSLAGFPASLRWGFGPIAQLVECLYGIEKVRGSNPLRSTGAMDRTDLPSGREGDHLLDKCGSTSMAWKRLRVQISFGPQSQIYYIVCQKNGLFQQMSLRRYIPRSLGYVLISLFKLKMVFL